MGRSHGRGWACSGLLLMAQSRIIVATKSKRSNVVGGGPEVTAGEADGRILIKVSGLSPSPTISERETASYSKGLPALIAAANSLGWRLVVAVCRFFPSKIDNVEVTRKSSWGSTPVFEFSGAAR